MMKPEYLKREVTIAHLAKAFHLLPQTVRTVVEKIPIADVRPNPNGYARYVDDDEIEQLCCWCKENGYNSVDGGIVGLINALETGKIAEQICAEWIPVQSTNHTNQSKWKCSNCHTKEKFKSSYCPTCGANMRKDG